MILVPTRELATQIAKAVDEYAKYLDVERLAVFGGVSVNEQTRKLSKGVEILVATSGRLMEHLRNNTVNLSSVSTVVIDEVDTMLDMGFLEDIEKILPNVGPNRQIMMLSATLNQNVKKLAKEFLTDPVVIEVSSQRSSVKIIDQQIILVDEAKKAELLSYLIGSKNYSQVLVFVNMKKEADELVEHLELDGLPSLCIHGDVRQSARAKAMRKFKEGEIRVLVATDIAARGIDIELLPVVVNFSLPETIADYTHRIGRTGRAGKEGVAISIVTPHEFRMLQKIEKSIGTKLEPKIVPNISSVKEKKITDLKNQISEQEIKDYALELVEDLKEEFDISTIAFKLASMISASTYVQGNNNIGKSESDIKRLIENSNRYDNDGSSSGRNSRGRGRGRSSDSRGGDRDRGPRTGDRGSRGGDRERSPRSDRPSGDRDRKPRGDRPSGDRKPSNDRERSPRSDRPSGDRDRKPRGDRPSGDRSRKRD